MNPEQHSPEHAPGGLPMGPEISPSESDPSREWLSGQETEQASSQERVEQQQSHRIEADHVPGVAMPATSIATLPSPLVPEDDTATATGHTPVAANDEDLIEKEWVEAIKKVLQTTRDDPYKREQAIKSVQMDYILKRYAKKIGETDD
jgi:hypothetical protein